MNCGHRSAIKQILDGDASPAFMVVLCISAINSDCAPKKGNACNKTTSSFDCDENLKRSDGPPINHTKVELTDGWYECPLTSPQYLFNILMNLDQLNIQINTIKFQVFIECCSRCRTLKPCTV